MVSALLLTGYAAHAANPSPQAKLLWKFSFDYSPFGRLITPPDGRQNTSSSTPAVAPDGTIYVGTFNGTLFALSPKGKEKWRFKSGLEIHSSPAIGKDGAIYFGSRDRHLYALNPDGTLQWKFATGGWVDSSPAIAKDGTIYFGSWDHQFYALNPDGSLKWKFTTGGIVDSSPAIATNGTIYFGSHDKYVYALNPNGSLRWKFLTGGEIVASPAIGAGGVIYVASLDGNLYALNPDGTERWRHHSGSCTFASPILTANGNIVIGNTNRTGIISKAGRFLWHHGSPVPINVAAAAVAGRLYLSAPWRTLLGERSGDHVLWKAGLDLNATSSLTVDARGLIYVCAGNHLLAIRPPGNFLPKPEGPWPMFRANPQHTGRLGK